MKLSGVILRSSQFRMRQIVIKNEIISGYPEGDSLELDGRGLNVTKMRQIVVKMRAFLY